MASKQLINLLSSPVHKGLSFSRAMVFNCEKSSSQISFIRHAGHAKWQNIAAQKKVTDMRRSKNASAMISKVKAAVKGGGSLDPAKNPQLASALEEATKKEVGKSVAQFLKGLSQRGEMREINIVYRGPQNAIVIISGTTDRPVIFRNDVVNIARKALLGYMEDKSAGGISQMFTERGEIKVLARSEGEEITMDRAEELAIECEAEEVEQDTDDELGQFYRFITAKVDFYKVKKTLDELEVNIEDYAVVFHPNAQVDLDDKEQQRLIDFFEKVCNVDDYDQVYTNVKLLS